MPTILLTGMPRSGTTLVCNLLNSCPDTVALGEPLQLDRSAGPERAVADIAHFAAATRRRALEAGVAVSKHMNGVVPDNWVEDPSVLAEGRRRRVLEQHGEIRIGKPLTPDFHLLIKAPAEFTALAARLLTLFPLYAMLRHPLAVLASWQTVEMPVHRGHMPMLECFTPGLAGRLDAIADRLARQVLLMSHLIDIYAGFPPGRVLRYEDLVRDPAGTLAALTPASGAVTRSLHAVVPAERYPGADLPTLAQALLALTPAVKRFYPDFNASLANYLG